MSLVSAGELMKALKFLEGRIPWVKCPLCDEEVSKLRKCNYWNRSNIKIDSSVCVECAEAARNLSFFAQKYKIPGVDVECSLLPVYKSLDSSWITNRSYKATVKLGEWSFLVWQEGPRLAVLENGKLPDEKKVYDNNYQVWFAIKKAFEEGKKAGIEENFVEKQKKWAWGKNE